MRQKHRGDHTLNHTNDRLIHCHRFQSFRNLLNSPIFGLAERFEQFDQSNKFGHAI